MELFPDRPVPECLLEEPVLPPHLEPVLDAFFHLSPGRGVGFGCYAGLNVADILAYWNACRWGTWDSFLRLVRLLDHAFLAHLEKTKPPEKS